MSDGRPRPIDRAVETATDRTRAAEQDYLSVPVTDEDVVPRAARVERRAEDLAVLARDAKKGEAGGTATGAEEPSEPAAEVDQGRED